MCSGELKPGQDVLRGSLVDPAVQFAAFDAHAATDLDELETARLGFAVELGATHPSIFSALTDGEQAALVNGDRRSLQSFALS